VKNPHGKTAEYFWFSCTLLALIALLAVNSAARHPATSCAAAASAQQAGDARAAADVCLR
jgi:hypothetical protein